MKRLASLFILVTLSTSASLAQDDMYFTPKSKAEKAEARKQRQAEEEAAREKELQQEEIIRQAREMQAKEWLRKNSRYLQQLEDGSYVYHSGSNRNVDEYNHRGKFASHYETVGKDSTGNDIISFTPGNGQYPDSLTSSVEVVMNDSIAKTKGYQYDDDDDYYYSRRLNRFDGYYGSRRAWLLYNDPWHYWAYDPWYDDPWYWGCYGPRGWYHSWCYDPWYWDDPWYWHGGWYGPGWCGPIWGPGYIGGVAVHGTPGTRNHGNFGPRSGVGGSRAMAQGVRSADRTIAASQSRGNFSGYRGNTSYSNVQQRGSFNNNTQSRSVSNFGGSSSRGSFSGGGGFGGGSRGGGGGGGHFGGRR